MVQVYIVKFDYQFDIYTDIYIMVDYILLTPQFYSVDLGTFLYLIIIVH